MRGARRRGRATRRLSLLATLAAGAGDFLFPPACEACGEEPFGRPPVLCLSCHRALRRGVVRFRLEGPGEPLPGAALGEMKGGLARLVRGLKYDGMSALAEPLGRALAWRLRHEPFPAAPSLLVAPVAGDPRRTRARGQDHAALLARALGRAAGLEVEPRLLRKLRATPSQTGLAAAERRRALAGCMEARSPARGWNGRSVLLVDDVVTTGATLGEARRALEAAGAAVCGALVLARTPAGIMAAGRSKDRNETGASRAMSGRA